MTLRRKFRHCGRTNKILDRSNFYQQKTTKCCTDKIAVRHPNNFLRRLMTMLWRPYIFRNAGLKRPSVRCSCIPLRHRIPKLAELWRQYSPVINRFIVNCTKIQNCSLPLQTNQTKKISFINMFRSLIQFESFKWHANIILYTPNLRHIITDIRDSVRKRKPQCLVEINLKNGLWFLTLLFEGHGKRRKYNSVYQVDKC